MAGIKVKIGATVTASVASAYTDKPPNLIPQTQPGRPPNLIPQTQPGSMCVGSKVQGGTGVNNIAQDLPSPGGITSVVNGNRQVYNNDVDTTSDSSIHNRKVGKTLVGSTS